MGADNSKGKAKKVLHRSDEKVHYDEQHRSASILHDGTSVDDETNSYSQEESPTCKNEVEMYTIEEPTENKLTGLPGEEIPVSIASPCIDEQDKLEVHNFQERTKMEGMNQENSCAQDFREVASRYETNFMDDINNESSKVNTDVEFEKQNEQNKAAWDIGPVVNEYYTVLDGKTVTGKAEETVDGMLNTEESTGTVKVLKDIKLARENFELPLHLDSEGKFKKKATSDNDDNRGQCDIDDDKLIHESIFTNVIFLPDKSTGASPKRYGPKRLGSVYDGIPEEDNDSDINSESTADDKSLQNIQMPGHVEKETDTKVYETIAERKQKTDSVEMSVAREGRAFEDSFIDKSRMDRAELRNNDGKVEDEKHSTDLFFVEDHFGLYTGSIAEGLSKEFKEEREVKQNNSLSGLTVLSHVKEENNNNENKDVEESNLNKFSHDLAQQHNIERTENVDKLKLMHNEKSLNSQALNLPTSKFELKQDWKPHKAREKDSSSLDDTFQEHEIVEICKNCREPRDLCICLFTGMKTVMPVLVDYQQKPHLAYLRYLRINDKEINWSILKSSQAIFIKAMKSRNTKISEDNRVAFKFELPAGKGFFVPLDRHESVEEEFEDDSQFKYKEGMSMVRSIENKIGSDFFGLELTSSIGSFRNIIVNNFDESSDTEEEVSEPGDVNGDYDESHRKDDNASEENEIILIIDKNITEKSCRDDRFNNKYAGDVLVNGHNDELESLAVDEESNFESDDEIENELVHVCEHRQQGGYFNCLDRDRCLHLGENLSIQKNAHEEDRDSNEEVNPFLRSTDYNEQVEQSQEGNNQDGFNSNLHDLYDLRNKEESERDLTENMAEESGNNSFIIENLQNDRSLKDSISVSSEENIVLNDIEIKSDIRTNECELETEIEVTETDKNKIDKCAITSKKIDSCFDDVKVCKLFVKEDNYKLAAIQSDKGNECMLTVSCPVVSNKGNKLSESTNMEISSGLKIDIGEVQETDGNLLFSKYKNEFPDKNKTKGATLESRKHTSLEDQNLASVSSQISVDTLETPETNECQASGETAACALSGQVNVESLKDKFNDKFDEDFIVDEVDTDKDSLEHEDMKTLKMHFGSNLRRKLTRIEEDNRFVEISSDDDEDVNECKFVTNIEEEVPSGKSRINLDMDDKEDEEEIVAMDGSGKISFMKRNGEGKIRSSGEKLPGLLSSGNLGSSPFKIQLPESLSSDLLASSDIDFSLPPDQFMKQLQERNLNLGGMLGKLRTTVGDMRTTVSDRPKLVARRHNDRRPRRPKKAKSDFAASFYDSSDRNVDISRLDSQQDPSSQTSSAEPYQNQANDSSAESAESRLHGQFESHRRIVLESDLRSTTTTSSSTSISFQSSGSETPVHNFDGSSDEEAPEVKLNELWNPVLQEEKNNCLQGPKIPASYRCTVLCVDVSESMQGLPWQHVKQFVPEFLSGLEEKKQSEKIEEFVALVTFGYKTKIVTQPAKNYTQLSKDFKSLRPDGNSPLLPGIALSLLIQTVRKELGQPYCKLHEIVVRHRIILISDGRPSPVSLVCTSDDFPDLIQEEACQEVESSLQEWKLPSQYTHVDCVPVGLNPNLAMLETICRVTNGRLVLPSDVKDLINSTHNHYIAAQVSKQMFQEKADPFDEHIFKSLVLSLYPATSHTDITEMNELVDAAKAYLLQRQLEGTDTVSNVSEEDSNFEPKDLRKLGLPQIGTRVVLGPDVTDKLFKFNVQKGTITGHSRKHRGKVFVHWDNGVDTLCNCGYNDKFEVFTADSKDQRNVDDQIKVGYEVRRGPDWKYGNQDGGADQLGTVIKIHRNGNVLVKWLNGNQNKYRYNQCGIYDILISDPNDPFGNKVFESEMNKRNQVRSDTPDLTQDANSVNSEFTGDKDVVPKFSGNDSVRPKSQGNKNSVRPKVLR